MKFSKLNLFVLAVSILTIANSFGAVVDYNKNILKNAQYAVVKCGASWCGPCKTIAPAFKKLSNLGEFNDIKFMDLDIDCNKAAACEYKIKSVPTFLFFKDGKLISRFSGNRQDCLKDELNKLKNK